MKWPGDSPDWKKLSDELAGYSPGSDDTFWFSGDELQQVDLQLEPGWAWLITPQGNLILCGVEGPFTDCLLQRLRIWIPGWLETQIHLAAKPQAAKSQAAKQPTKLDWDSVRANWRASLAQNIHQKMTKNIHQKVSNNMHLKVSKNMHQKDTHQKVTSQAPSPKLEFLNHLHLPPNLGALPINQLQTSHQR